MIDFFLIVTGHVELARIASLSRCEHDSFAAVSGFGCSDMKYTIPNFFIGLSFSLFGMLYVLTRAPAANKEAIPPGLVKVPVTHAPTSCPKCGAKNHPTAASCAQCRTELTPSYASEVSKA